MNNTELQTAITETGRLLGDIAFDEPRHSALLCDHFVALIKEQQRRAVAVQQNEPKCFKAGDRVRLPTGALATVESIVGDRYILRYKDVGVGMAEWAYDELTFAGAVPSKDSVTKEALDIATLRMKQLDSAATQFRTTDVQQESTK